MTKFTSCLKSGRLCYFADKMFKWFSIKEFLSTPEEWHALVEGFCEVVCFWPSRYLMSDELENDLLDEHHYYIFGRVLGFGALIGIIIGLVKVIV